MKSGSFWAGLILASLPSSALAAEGGGVMDIATSTMFWTWVTFIVVLLIMWKFAWGPIARSLHDREESIRKAIADAEEAKKKAEELEKTFQEKLEGARAEAEAIIREGRDDAVRVKEKYEKEQRAEANAMKDRALNEIELAKGKALEEIRQEARTLSIEIARKVLEREVSAQDHTALVDQALAGYGKAVEGEQEG